ncbi:MAG: tetratricopeptide repeat protein [Nitrospira sp.]|nr:tetratricopeptide repeat protein [Nitrospira sp.]
MSILWLRSWFLIGAVFAMEVGYGVLPFYVDASPDVTVDTQATPIATEPGLGADQRQLVAVAVSHIKARRLSEADNILDQVLAVFRGKLTDPGAIYISAATRDEFADYKKTATVSGKIIWLDWSFREALHLKAFIEAASKRFEPALQFLAEEIKYAPTAAAPYIEQGYIRNQLGDPKAALEAYSLALDRSRRHVSSAPLEGPALRGMGVALIDLGDLDLAERWLRESLKVEPANPVAVHELEYIKQRRGASLAP